MKTERNDKTSLGKKFIFSNLVANMYYFFALHLYLIISIIGVAIGLTILLFVAELLFPRYVHIFNYKMTDTILTELYDNHKYHAAIAFYETKKDIIDNSKEPWKYTFELADCYINTGDYPKALDQYQKLRTHINELIAKEKPETLSVKDMNFLQELMEISILKEEFRIYLKMGAIPEINRFYNEIKELHESIDWNKLYSVLPKEDSEKLQGLLDGRKFQDGFRLELIQGSYLTNPHEAIMEMEKYIDEVIPSTKYNIIRILFKMINRDVWNFTIHPD